MDPLCPLEKQQVPIFVQSEKPEPQTYDCDFCVETDVERFVDYIFATKLRLYFYTANSDLLYAQSEIDLSQILTSASVDEFFQIPVYPCEHMTAPLGGKSYGHLQFAAGIHCKPRVNPFKLSDQI